MSSSWWPFSSSSTAVAASSPRSLSTSPSPDLADADSATGAQPKCKPCCACPDTRRPRDDCVVQFGPDSVECRDLIRAHQDCMRSMGFNV